MTVSAPKTVRRKPVLSSILAAAVLTVSISPLWSQERQVVQVDFSSGQADTMLEDVLYLALGIELANAGYSTTRSPQAVLYVLKAHYDLHEDGAAVSLALTESRGLGATLATYDFMLILDSSFDLSLADAVQRIFAMAALSPVPGAQGAPEIGGLFSSSLVPKADLLRTTKTRRVELVAAAGGIPFLGSFSDYSSYGVYGSLQAGLLFLKPSWSFSAGGRLSANRAFMADGVAGGPVYLSTAGVNVQYGLGAAQRFRLAACSSGGAAFISIPVGEVLFTKTVPYADLGVQAGFPVARDLFLGGELRVLGAFDPDVLMLGVAATVSLCKEF
jgi:hypothetical protein